MSNSFGFRKVIGQKTDEEPAAPTPAPAAAPTPATPSYSSQPAAAPAAQAAPAPQRPVGPSRNVLSSDVEIKGTVKFTNDLVVDGRIEGEIHSDGNLTVGENARLKAEIKTGTVVVYGKVHGNIIANDRVELKASAEVVGDIKAKTLSMEPGAIFVGKSAVGTPSTPAAKSEPSKAAEQPKQGNLSGVKA
ncbi:bactofilin family protein [Luteolibacter marinus]|uniref:bactofilin family protein n=1 Tax=Luteolibacter marinus TaxID=2776705 RepID=UPI001D0255D1|nr:polymer-forming cytoskeletal protein [Luteolibacter marinus]